MVCMVSVYWTVRHLEKASTLHTERSLGSLGQSSDARQIVKPQSKARNVAIQALWYVGAFYATFTFATINRLVQQFAQQTHFELIVIHATVEPMQGLFNYIVYIRPRILKLRTRFPGANPWQLFSMMMAVAKGQSIPAPNRDGRPSAMVFGGGAVHMVRIQNDDDDEEAARVELQGWRRVITFGAGRRASRANRTSRVLRSAHDQEGDDNEVRRKESQSSHVAGQVTGAASSDCAKLPDRRDSLDFVENSDDDGNNEDSMEMKVLERNAAAISTDSSKTDPVRTTTTTTNQRQQQASRHGSLQRTPSRWAFWKIANSASSIGSSQETDSVRRYSLISMADLSRLVSRRLTTMTTEDASAKGEDSISTAIGAGAGAGVGETDKDNHDAAAATPTTTAAAGARRPPTNNEQDATAKIRHANDPNDSKPPADDKSKGLR